MDDLERFRENLNYLVEAANEYAKRHPTLVEVSWNRVLWTAVPKKVDLKVTYDPDGSKIITQDITIDARVVVNRDTVAFIQMCLQAME